MLVTKSKRLSLPLDILAAITTLPSVVKRKKERKVGSNFELHIQSLMDILTNLQRGFRSDRSWEAELIITIHDLFST